MTLPPVSQIAEPDTVRLIPSGRLKPPVLQPLADSDDELRDLAELEGATNDRLIAETTGTAALRREELVYERPYASFINASFAHTRPGGNRFNPESRGAWYSAFRVETALAEVAYHLTRELRNIGRFENRTEYTELFAGFIGPFHDLRGAEPVPDCLHPDPATGYPAGQQLAASIIAGGGSGVLYPSVRHEGGTCLAAFHPHLVQNVRPGGLWQLAWSGSPVPTTTRV